MHTPIPLHSREKNALKFSFYREKYMVVIGTLDCVIMYICPGEAFN